jgi:hypothetical protein
MTIKSGFHKSFEKLAWFFFGGKTEGGHEIIKKIYEKFLKKSIMKEKNHKNHC